MVSDVEWLIKYVKVLYENCTSCGGYWFQNGKSFSETADTFKQWQKFNMNESE